MKKALTLLLAAVALGAAGYYGYSRLGPETASLQLVTATVTRGDVVQTIDATGRLEAMTTVQVGSQVSGTIKALHADFNSTVRRGQVIAELEPSLFETQVEQARATVVRLQAEVERARIQAQDADLKFARARELAGRQLVPTTDLETADVNAKAAAAALRAAEAQVVQAQASLNQSQVNLSHTIIRAPIDGVVISRSVDVGQTVAASMQAPTLFQIANDMTRMQVSCNIDESDIGQVEAGQPVSFTVDAYPNETFSGTVQQVRLSPVIESNVVSYVTIVEVPNPNLRLKPGMTATVTVEVARAADVLRVPASALRFTPTEALFASLGQSLTPDAGALSG
ncbi:MAG: efflux RND transporter periplasmic adaptor subunit, partial [Acidobacteria bacterium]|nr:efflux RND transporter periplasmic adaptor subunit [Acidobacteriota bacterium]